MYIKTADFYKWFEEYLECYLKCPDLEIRVNYELKYEHTLRVKENILAIGRSLKLSEAEKAVILNAIKYHDYFVVPEDEPDAVKFFSRLIRDADKLDAFYFETKSNEQRRYDLGELSAEIEYSEEVISDIMNRRQVNFKNFNTNTIGD